MSDKGSASDPGMCLLELDSERVNANRKLLECRNGRKLTIWVESTWPVFKVDVERDMALEIEDVFATSHMDGIRIIIIILRECIFDGVEIRKFFLDKR
jgi:hypothetical protein